MNNLTIAACIDTCACAHLNIGYELYNHTHIVKTYYDEATYSQSRETMVDLQLDHVASRESGYIALQKEEYPFPVKTNEDCFNRLMWNITQYGTYQNDSMLIKYLTQIEKAIAADELKSYAETTKELLPPIYSLSKTIRVETQIVRLYYLYALYIAFKKCVIGTESFSPTEQKAFSFAVKHSMIWGIEDKITNRYCGILSTIDTCLFSNEIPHISYKPSATGIERKVQISSLYGILCYRLRQMMSFGQSAKHGQRLALCTNCGEQFIAKDGRQKMCPYCGSGSQRVIRHNQKKQASKGVELNDSKES